MCERELLLQKKFALPFHPKCGIKVFLNSYFEAMIKAFFALGLFNFLCFPHALLACITFGVEKSQIKFSTVGSFKLNFFLFSF
jgi:hypothetical protein